MKTFAWVSFWLVAAIWGSSFLLIRVGVEHFTPGQIAVIRCAIAAVGLNAVLLARGNAIRVTSACGSRSPSSGSGTPRFRTG